MAKKNKHKKNKNKYYYADNNFKNNYLPTVKSDQINQIAYSVFGSLYYTPKSD